MFSEYPIRTSDLARAITCELAKIPKTAGYRTYTRVVRTLLSDLVASEACLKCYPNIQESSGEYLWDASWWREIQDDRQMLMALESEWSDKVQDVIYDFEKLLVAKAPLKVLVTDSRTWTNDFKNRLDLSLKQYAQHIKGERYAWLDLEGKPVDLQGTRKPAQLHLYEWTAEVSGFDRNASFEKIGDQPISCEPGRTGD